MSAEMLRTAGAVTGVYEKLRADILAGGFQPDNVLSEIPLSRRYGTSRTPIREALHRLEAEQLVVRTARGMRVRKTTPEEILEIYDARIILEGAAAKAAALKRTDYDLARLDRVRDEMRALPLTAAAKHAVTNRAFHETLWQASHSATLVDLLSRLSVHLIRYSDTTLTGVRWIEALDEHDEILEAIRNRDQDRARELAESHMTAARAARLKMYSARASL